MAQQQQQQISAYQQQSVLQFVIVGQNDYPLFDVDLTARSVDPNVGRVLCFFLILFLPCRPHPYPLPAYSV